MSRSADGPAMRYELYYWPMILGRGELVRLALEDAGAAYVDVAREAGTQAMMRLIADAKVACPPFAPPFLKAGKLIIAQTANILLYLGARHRLAPAGEAGKLWAHPPPPCPSPFLLESSRPPHSIA